MGWADSSDGTKAIANGLIYIFTYLNLLYVYKIKISRHHIFAEKYDVMIFKI